MKTHLNKSIRWIFFDFGGCLDSDGVHSRTLFQKHFVNGELLNQNESTVDFQNAYTFSDRKIIDESLVQNANLLRMNQVLCELIAGFLNWSDINKIDKIARAITSEQIYYLKRNQQTLSFLSAHYKLGVVSNFSGNLSLILNEFSLNPFFDFALDSYHVGHSKPDPLIFMNALTHSRVRPDQVCFVGDNVERDIIPAQHLGMTTILISPDQDTSVADFTVKTLTDLLELSQRA